MAWTFFNDNLGFPTLDHDATRSEFSLLNLAPPSIAFGVPQLNVAGLTTLGANTFQPQGPRENIYTLADDFSWIRGRHTLKFGFDGRSYRPAAKVQASPNGSFTFANQFTTSPAFPAPAAQSPTCCSDCRSAFAPRNWRRATGG